MAYFSRRTVSVVLLVLLLILPIESADNSNPSTGYHDYDSLTQSLKTLTATNPKIAKLESIGKTLQGKDLWMLQISGVKEGKPEEKQTLLIVGNLEGDHVIGSEVALGIAEYLINGYGKDEKVTGVLDKRAFYIIPRLNPEGAEAFFAKIKQEHPGNFKPRDDDYDWLVDEDGPEDINGDGMITLMRVKDKDGEWYIDKKDPRLMKKKEADTPLESLYKVYPEGIDDDGDGLYNEDGPGGFDINRNFPHNFGYKPKGIGVYPASEVETQALIDFMTRYIPQLKIQPHKNICGVLVFSKYDNLAAGSGIECGTPTFPEPSRGEEAEALQRQMAMMFFRFGRRGAQEPAQPRPTDPQPKKTESRDEHIFKSVCEKYKEITKINSALSEKPFGSLLEYAYFQFGVPAFSANLWSLREEAQARPQERMTQRSDQSGEAQTRRMDPSAMMQRFAARSREASPAEASNNDEKWLEWIDKNNKGKGFVGWTKYKHKQLGEVEIGGFEPYLRINPAADQIPGLSKSHAEFAMYLASQFAEITMDEPAVEKLSSNLFQLTVKVHNNGSFPYVTAMGSRTQNINSIMIRLKFEDDDGMKLFGGSKRYDLSTLEAGGEKEYKWIIISLPGKRIDITLWARNGGGTAEKKVVLK